MADISKIKLPGDSAQYNVKDSVARAGMTEFIEDTRTAAGAALTGVSASDSLYDGKHIIFFSKYALANNVTLKLTLADGTETAAVPVYYYGTSRMGTRYGANYVIPLTYYNEKWYADGDYDSNTTTISNLTYNYGGWIADRVVYRYQLLVMTDADHVSPFNVVSNGYSSSTKAILTDIEFDPFGRMFFYNTTTTGAAGAVLSAAAMLYAVGIFDLRYSFNIANATASGLVGNKDTYMKVIPQANGKVKLASDWPLTQTLPTTDDGYWYIHIGRQYDWYRTSLYPTHEVLWHDGNSIQHVNKDGMSRIVYEDYEFNYSIAAGGTVGQRADRFYLELQHPEYKYLSATIIWDSDGDKLNNLPMFLQNASQSRVYLYVYRASTSAVTSGKTIVRMTALAPASQGTGYFEDNDTYDRIRYNQPVKAKIAFSAGAIIGADDSGYFALMPGRIIDLNYPILYARDYVAVNHTGTWNFMAYPTATPTVNVSDWTGTAGKTVYVTGTLSGSMLTLPSTASKIFTTTKPTTADGKVYIPIGALSANSTTSMYFYGNTKGIWEYKAGEFKSYVEENKSNVKVTSFNDKVDTANNNADISCHRYGGFCNMRILSLHVTSSISDTGVLFTLPESCRSTLDNLTLPITKVGTYETSMMVIRTSGTVKVPAGIPAGWYTGGGTYPLA